MTTQQFLERNNSNWTPSICQNTEWADWEILEDSLQFSTDKLVKAVSLVTAYKERSRDFHDTVLCRLAEKGIFVAMIDRQPVWVYSNTRPLGSMCIS